MSTLLASLARFLLTIVVLTWGLSESAVGQAIPSNIPDGATSPAETQREQLKERHRDVLSRFFTGGHLAAAPAWAEGPSAFAFQFEAGFDVGVHDAVYLALGAREYVKAEAARRDAGGHRSTEHRGWARTCMAFLQPTTKQASLATEGTHHLQSARL
jgi:hypothetical protein